MCFKWLYFFNKLVKIREYYKIWFFLLFINLFLRCKVICMFCGLVVILVCCKYFKRSIFKISKWNIKLFFFWLLWVIKYFFMCKKVFYFKKNLLYIGCWLRRIVKFLIIWSIFIMKILLMCVLLFSFWVDV